MANIRAPEQAAPSDPAGDVDGDEATPDPGASIEEVLTGLPDGYVTL